MQVSDERTHQPCLAHARGQREAQRGELALEILQRGELGLQCGENGRDIPFMAQQIGRGIEHACQLIEGFCLRRTKRQTTGDGVQDAVVHYSFSPNRPP